MPTITIKMRQILEAVPALTRLTENKFPASVAFDLAGIVKKLQAELNDYEDTRIKLIKEYGESVPIMRTDEEGKEVPTGQSTIKVKAEFLELFSEEINTLLNKDIEIPGIRLLSLKSLDCVELSIDEIRLIEFVIDLPKDE